MSFDLKLSRKCDHRLHRQIRPFLADRRTVRLRTVIGSTADFRVRLNGYDAPSGHAVSGWELIKDESSVETGQKKVVFFKKRPSTTDWVELTYYTDPSTCPKCLGVRLLFDYEYSNIGRPLVVENEAKLIQDLEKIVLTIKGSSLYHPWYGTSIVTMVGSKEPKGIFRLQIQRDISNATSNIKDLQAKQEEFQEVTNREFLYQVEAIVVRETDDPTLFQVDVRGRTQAGGNVDFSRALRFGSPLFEEISNRVVG